MVFSSSVFLFVFMPVFFILYFLCPNRKVKNTWLLLASLVFYAWGEPVYILLMLVSIVTNWILGIAVGRAAGDSPEGSGVGAPHNGREKLLLLVACVFNILVIGFFKYEGFVAENINLLVGMPLVPDLELPLPIGISFYTLQALSYVIDVYRREVEPQRNVLFLGMYIACFPQLIAGPIVRYQTIQEQVLGRQETLSDFASGLRLFIVGLSKKVLLANTCAILADSMLSQGGATIGAVGAWGGLIAYTFQIFFDFSGYSDMAIGLGRMMGFKYLRNFNYPYISKSISEFWRRWHISLSTFFRDYIFIPLGGSRVSTARNIFNISVVWATTGLWHGAAWNYIGWGVYYGALLIAEKYLWGDALKRLPVVVQHIYCIAIFVFGWSFFWITDPSQLIPYWQAMIGQFGATGTSTFWELGVWEFWPVFVVCIIASVPVCPYLKFRFLAWVEGREPGDFKKESIVNPKHHASGELCAFEAEPETPQKARALVVASVAWDICLLVLLFASAASVVSGSFNPFIYFQF
ncbi:MAG: MBOAT family protein [Coriobacteriaceae bacterium]|nr:MBOAT family protein [Coriobacteriaceae bacterium]